MGYELWGNALTLSMWGVLNYMLAGIIAFVLGLILVFALIRFVFRKSPSAIWASGFPLKELHLAPWEKRTLLTGETEKSENRNSSNVCTPTLPLKWVSSSVRNLGILSLFYLWLVYTSTLVVPGLLFSLYVALTISVGVRSAIRASDEVDINGAEEISLIVVMVLCFALHFVLVALWVLPHGISSFVIGYLLVRVIGGIRSNSCAT